MKTCLNDRLFKAYGAVSDGCISGEEFSFYYCSCKSPFPPSRVRWWLIQPDYKLSFANSWALSAWDPNRDRRWSTAQLLLHISSGYMDKKHFHPVTCKNVWSTRNLPISTIWFSFLGCETREKVQCSEPVQTVPIYRSSSAALVISHSKHQLWSHLHKTSPNAYGLNFVTSGVVHKTVPPMKGALSLLRVRHWLTDVYLLCWQSPGRMLLDSVSPLVNRELKVSSQAHFVHVSYLILHTLFLGLKELHNCNSNCCSYSHHWFFQLLHHVSDGLYFIVKCPVAWGHFTFFPLLMCFCPFSFQVDVVLHFPDLLFLIFLFL